jgi:hypothetical protein
MGGRTRSVAVWKMAPHCIMWCIWSEKTIDVSRTRRGLERSSSISFFLLFTLGLQAGLPRGLLALQIFFLTSLLPPSPPCILSVY